MIRVLSPADRQAAFGMSEDQLQEEIRGGCRKLGLAVQHITDSRRCWLPGWPDLVIIGTGLLFRELKSERGVLPMHQRAVGSQLARAGQDWAVWRPRDWVDGTIERQMREIA